ncbi:MAG: conserved membrane protein of unknown function [Nitrospira sp.]|nr:hypothetical protein [Nitrospira sp.]ULA58460.1 MAG: conserved membrane protein of unknown function [Nitrospira sp.]
MHKFLRHMVWIVTAVMLQGCIGLGAWTLGTRTESSDRPKIDETRGAIDLRQAGTEADRKTALELRRQWGEPDRIESREDGKEEWIYKTGGLRWAGMVLYLVIIPLPAMIPVGTQDVSVLIYEGYIEQATSRDWAFKAGAYCGFFGMVYGGLGCGTGTFEEKQRSASPS